MLNIKQFLSLVFFRPVLNTRHNQDKNHYTKCMRNIYEYILILLIKDNECI